MACMPSTSTGALSSVRMVDDESGSLVSGLTQVECLGGLLHGVLFGTGTRLLGEQFAVRGIRHVGRQHVPIAEFSSPQAAQRLQ